MENTEESEEGTLQKISFEVGAEFCGERVDKVISELIAQHYLELKLTRSKIEKLIEEGAVYLNGKQLRSKSYKIEKASIVEFSLSDESAAELKGDAEVKYDLVYEDESLVVINKPAGLIVHPGDGNESGTLAHGLAHRYKIKGVGHPKRPGIVHRLDKDTSGLMVIALEQQVLNALLEQFKPPRKIHRTYLAFTRKPPKGSELPTSGIISAAIGRDPKNPVKMAVSKEGRPAATRYKIIEEFKEALLVELELETGRTHQIRVHLENIGIPILGDPVYRRGSATLSAALERSIPSRQALHAAKLSFEHPVRVERMTFESELPQDLQELLVSLRS